MNRYNRYAHAKRILSEYTPLAEWREESNVYHKLIGYGDKEALEGLFDFSKRQAFARNAFCKKIVAARAKDGYHLFFCLK